jgi:3-oxoadipate enol-lactonase
MTTVVMCGSLGAPAAVWDAQLPVLDGHSVVRVDHPGHGGADLAEIADVGDLAARVLAAAGSRRFAYVGLSLGGAVGLRLAIDHPDRVERLVLACTAVQFGEPAQWIERAATVRAHGLGAIVDAVLARWFTPGFDAVAAYREHFLNADPEGYARCCEALAGFDVRDAIGAITAPTLAIAASEDPTTPPAVVDVVARGIPGARFEVIRYGAHLVNVERPADFNRLLEEFL